MRDRLGPQQASWGRSRLAAHGGVIAAAVTSWKSAHRPVGCGAAVESGPGAVSPSMSEPPSTQSADPPTQAAPSAGTSVEPLLSDKARYSHLCPEAKGSWV